jgi:putative tricarboxylic transport membrane protein
MLILLFPTESVTATPKLTPKSILRVSLLLLLMVSYGLAIEILGFLVSTVLFLGIGFWIMGERKLKVILLIATVTAFTFWLSLTQFLKIYLDSGSLIKFVFGLLNLG